MKRIFIAFLFFSFCGIVRAQEIIIPDCIIPPISVSTAVTNNRFPSSGFDNRNMACTTWHLMYANDGFTTVSVEIDQAQTASGVAGTWTIWPPGNLASGSLPMTTTTSNQVTAYKYFPWISILITTTGSGTLRVTAYGFKPGANASDANGTSSGSTTTNLTQFGGVNISTGVGAGGAGIPRVTVSNDSNILATQSGTWTVQPGNTANTTAWKVDGSAVTQPVSGTFWQATQPVSAASLPLPAGASTAAKQPALGTAGAASADVITVQGIAAMTKLLVTPDALPANQSVNIAQINGVTTLTGNGLTGTGSQRVTISSDNTAFAVNNTQQGTAAQNITQFGGNNVATGTGIGGVGIPRVTISNDSSLAANQSVNVSQWNGQTAAQAANGVPKVGIVGNANAAVDAVMAAAVPANGIQIAGRGTGAAGAPVMTAPIVCDNWTPFSLASTTALKIITKATSKLTYICSINIVIAAANNVALISGTLTTNPCDTSTVGLAGGTTAATGWNFAANGGLTQGTGVGVITQAGATLDVCLLASAATQVSGVISWAQF